MSSHIAASAWSPIEALRAARINMQPVRHYVRPVRSRGATEVASPLSAFWQFRSGLRTPSVKACPASPCDDDCATCESRQIELH